MEAKHVPQSWDLPREQAIPKLVDRHAGRLRVLGERLCGNTEEAEDLVQEIFVQAWRKWDQFDHRADPIVWLYTIARRACTRMHRKRVGEPARLESLHDLLPFEGKFMTSLAQGGPLDEQIRREQVEAIEAEIVKLPLDFRMALILKDVIGFSIREVAKVLDVKPATVKTRVHRARLRLRAALESNSPRREVPAASYSRQVCLDLLHAKQDSLDRGVEMPNADSILCERCEAVFSALDLTKSICDELARCELSDASRKSLVARLNSEASR